MFVGLGILTSRDAFASINVETIGLLTGCMLISAHMEKQGGYQLLARALTARGSSMTFLGLVCCTSAVSAALLTNDSACVTLTPIILDACKARRLHPAPFLLALATSANIGASCTPIGSPQNMLIAVTSKMTFFQFLGILGLPTVVGLFINFVVIAVLYRKQLLPNTAPFINEPPTVMSASHVLRDEHHNTQLLGGHIEGPGSEALIPENSTHTSVSAPVHSQLQAVVDVESEVVISSSRVDSFLNLPARATGDATSLHIETPVGQVLAGTGLNAGIASENSRIITNPGSALSCASCLLWRVWIVRGILVAFPVILAAGSLWVGLGWTALLVASALCVADGQAPGPLLARVDGELLLFFSGLFVCVAGLNATGLPQIAWASVKDVASVGSASGVAVFSIVILIGSQVVSNVPLVLLLSPRILEMSAAEASLAWALLSWVSTVGGNLTLLGSVANIIVVERAKSNYIIGFFEYGRVGVPSTVALCVLGVPLVCALVRAMPPL